MNKESDTPRTDEVAEGYWYSEMLNHAENLERELADMTKQRDALAEAGNQLLDSLYSQDWRKLPAIRSMRKALAATKGGQHE